MLPDVSIIRLVKCSYETVRLAQGFNKTDFVKVDFEILNRDNSTLLRIAKMKTRKSKIKAKPLCSRLRRVVRAASDQAVQEGQNPELAKHAAAIRTLGKRVVTDIVEIGRRLTEAKKIVVHGKWAEWLQTEFEWSEGTALNFMRVYDLAESINFTDLSLADLIIAPSALYTLARPSMPGEVRDEMIERAAAGEAITNSTLQEFLAKRVASVKEALDPPPPAEPPAADETATTDDVEVSPPPAADEPPAADDAQQATAEPLPAEPFVEDDPEDAWVRGLYYRANRGIGDAHRHGDWSKYPIDPGVIEMVRQCAEAWQELYEYLKQRE